MALSMSIPALLFPAISLTMLAYNARYLAIAGLIRQLFKEYEATSSTKIHRQISNLRRRLGLIRWMQAIAILSFLTSVITMSLLYLDMTILAHIVFGVSLLCLMISLIFSFIEVQISTKALAIQLDTMEQHS